MAPNTTWWRSTRRSGRILDAPGRYALVGLPCHIQGLRLAQRRSRRLRERVKLTMGVFCGLTNEPRATAVLARQAGLDPADVREVSYRGPGWPGGMRLVTDSGLTRWRAYPDYIDRRFLALTPPRCRICPDALAELADVSVGDAWLDRFEGSDGVSDIIARTAAGERLLDEAAASLVLESARPAEMVASQAETYGVKRGVCRGRLWLRSLARPPCARLPGSRSVRVGERPPARCRRCRDGAPVPVSRRQALSGLRSPRQLPRPPSRNAAWSRARMYSESISSTPPGKPYSPMSCT